MIGVSVVLVVDGLDRSQAVSEILHGRATGSGGRKSGAVDGLELGEKVAGVQRTDVVVPLLVREQGRLERHGHREHPILDPGIRIELDRYVGILDHLEIRRLQISGPCEVNLIWRDYAGYAGFRSGGCAPRPRGRVVAPAEIVPGQLPAQCSRG